MLIDRTVTFKIRFELIKMEVLKDACKAFRGRKWQD